MNELDGIGINVPWPDLYCDLLAYAQSRYFSNELNLASLEQGLHIIRGKTLPQIDETRAKQVDWEAFSYLLGWHTRDQIEQLIHREWLDIDSNEFNAHKNTFASLPALQTCSRIMLGGAGLGRLAQDLLRRDSLQEVLCSDLSYMALASARKLIDNRSRDLAQSVCRPREDLQINSNLQIQQRDLENKYIPGFGLDPRLSFQVIDCYQIPDLPRYDAVVLCYLLDIPLLFDTMLLRVIERMHPGQRLVILTNVTARRDPRPIHATLSNCGLSIEHLAIERLPYSLSKHDFTFTQAICPTLVVQARLERRFDAKPVRVYPTTSIATMIQLIHQKIVPDQRRFALPIERSDHLSNPNRLKVLLESAFSSKSYDHFCKVLRGQFESDLAESLISYMCARYMMMITSVRGT